MTVAIVGAGPGDPGLVTVRALELVRACEILVYDRLVSFDLVSQAVGATRIAREGLNQDEVNDLLVHHGRCGRKVVRLKGGVEFDEPLAERIRRQIRAHTSPLHVPKVIVPAATR